MLKFTRAGWPRELEDIPVELPAILSQALGGALTQYSGGGCEEVPLRLEQFWSLVEQMGSTVLVDGVEYQLVHQVTGFVRFIRVHARTLASSDVVTSLLYEDLGRMYRDRFQRTQCVDVAVVFFTQEEVDQALASQVGLSAVDEALLYCLSTGQLVQEGDKYRLGIECLAEYYLITRDMGTYPHPHEQAQD